MSRKILSKSILCFLIAACVFTSTPVRAEAGVFKNMRISDMKDVRQSVAGKIGEYVEAGLDGYNDISDIEVTTDYSITERSGKKDYDTWNDQIIVTCTPKKGFSNWSNYEKKKYMVQISERAELLYSQCVKQISASYYNFLMTDNATTENKYEACQKTYVDVYCVTKKHTYYYNDHRQIRLSSDPGRYSNFFIDGVEKDASTTQKSKSSSSADSSAGSTSRKSSAKSSVKTYNTHDYDPSDYDDPDEFAEDAEDEYGSYDAAYDAWENY